MGSKPNKEKLTQEQEIMLIFYRENAETINVLHDLWAKLGPYARQMLEQVKPGISERVERAIKR